jgi:hypothetical protein
MDRHYYCARLADKYLAAMTDEEIVTECPDDYGARVSDDHRTLVWNNLYDEFGRMGDMELYMNYAHYVLSNRPVPRTLKESLFSGDDYFKTVLMIPYKK